MCKLKGKDMNDCDFSVFLVVGQDKGMDGNVFSHVWRYWMFPQIPQMFLRLLFTFISVLEVLT